MTGRLVLAGTPIGNLSDASAALKRELVEADVIAAEDTRRLRTLLAGLNITTDARIVSHYEQNEAFRAGQLVEALQQGQRVLVVTDAGMPTVSDPGYRLVRAAIAAGIEMTVVPGPSAVLVALALSGLPTDRFCFEGFIPRKNAERARRLKALADEQRTMVFFESPHRLAAFLAAAAQAFGPDRQAAVSRELTKAFEETKRGTLAELESWAGPGVRGEITVCIAGRETPELLDVAEAVDLVNERVTQGVSLASAAAAVAEQTGYSRNELYKQALETKKEKRRDG